MAPRSHVPCDCVSAAAWGEGGGVRRVRVQASRRRLLRIKMDIYKPAGLGTHGVQGCVCRPGLGVWLGLWTVRWLWLPFGIVPGSCGEPLV